jgi:hypothetical protein
MIQAFRIAGTVTLVILTALLALNVAVIAFPFVAIFGLAMLGVGYLIRSAVQEHRDKGRGVRHGPGRVA